MKLSVVIPAHNEEGCIERTVRILHGHLNAERIEHEILIVNDNSSDDTEAILLRLQEEIPTVTFTNNPPPNGFGFAVRRGLEHYTGDVVAVYMADGSDRPEDLVEFCEVLEKQQVDCVFGSRFVRGAKVVGYPFLKLTLNRLANLFIRMVFGLRYNDVTNAFKVYRRHVIDGLKPFLSHHFNLTVELPLKAIVRGYSYAVIPNDWINRKTGISKLNVQEMGSRYLFIVFYCLIEKWFSKGDYQKSRSEQPQLDQQNDSALQLKRFSLSWLILATSVVSLMWAIVTATVGWHNSISDLHGFRQSQTAITSYYLARGGPFLRYETPIFGYPWSIPFEFPLYQWIVANTSKLLHLQLESSGRLISELFFALSLIAMWGVLAELRVRWDYRLIFVTICLVSPQYVFWSRTFMIESTALFFCMAYLYFVARFARTGKPLDACLGGLCGILGALVKLTTFPAFALVGGAIYLYGRKRRGNALQNRSTLSRLLSSHLASSVLFIGLPVFLAWLWVRYTDQVRALNMVTGPLSSTNLWTWNFGTWEQKLSSTSWKVILNQTIPDLLGSPVSLFLAAVGIFVARHRWLPFLISLLGFLTAFLIFTNLHVVHNYYAYANGIFLLAAVSWAIVALLESGNWRRLAGTALFLIIVITSINGYYSRLYATQSNNANLFNNLAFTINRITPPGDVVLIFSREWTSELPYYSERRALIWPRWMPRDLDAPAIREAIGKLQGYRIGAVALCDGSQKNVDLVQKTVNGFSLTTSPEYEDSQCAVYASAGRTTNLPAPAGPTPDYLSHYGWANCDTIGGWIWNRNQPDESVVVEIFDGDARLAGIPANQFRQDLLDGGIGNGNHSFVYKVPDKLKDGQQHSIELKTPGTNYKLSDGPKVVMCPK